MTKRLPRSQRLDLTHPMRELIFKRPGAVIFAAALLVRLVYLVVVTQPPVQFDARQYTAVAAVAPLAVTNPSLWNDSTGRESISFSRVINDLVDDEDIIWAPYDPPSYGQALDWLFFSGPTYPTFLSITYHLTPAYDFWVVRILQAIIDSLTALLIFLIMRRLLSDRGGLVAAIIWIVYGPAIIKTGELLTETLAIFLTAAMVWSLLRGYDSRRIQWLAIAGALCSGLALTKASTTLLVVPMALAWMWASRRSERRPFSGAGIFIGAWIVVMIPWLLLVNHRYGQFAVRDPSYGDANFRQANILETEGYNTDKAPTDFWTYPVWREIRNHPLEYGRLYLQKFRRLWWRACDDYRIGFPFGAGGVQWMHRLLVLFAAVGVCIWTRRAGPAAWLPIAVIVYFAGLHTVMHVVSRYNLLAMPFVIGAAVSGAAWLANDNRPGFARRLAAILAVVVLAICIVFVVRPAFWLMLPGVGASLAIRLYWIVAAAVIVIAPVAAAMADGRGGSSRIPISACVGAGLALVFLGWATTREAHAEWAARISKPGIEVRREIILPPYTSIQEAESAEIHIDGVVSPDAHFSIAMDLDGARSVFAESLLVDVASFYAKANYLSFMRINGDHTSNVRCWSRNPVTGPILDSMLADGVVNIAISIMDQPDNRGSLDIFGDLPQDSAGVFAGPGGYITSIERYYEGTDPRLWNVFPMTPVTSSSFLTIGTESDTTDLSPCFGRQTGQYRILLRLLLADGRSLYF